MSWQTSSELLVDLDDYRAEEKFNNRLRWTSFGVCIVSWTAFFAGLVMAVWSGVHRVDWGGACTALIMPGFVFGMVTLFASILLTGEVLDARSEARKLEVRYNAAVMRENNL